MRQRPTRTDTVMSPRHSGFYMVMDVLYEPGAECQGAMEVRIRSYHHSYYLRQFGQAACVPVHQRDHIFVLLGRCRRLHPLLVGLQDSALAGEG